MKVRDRRVWQASLSIALILVVATTWTVVAAINTLKTEAAGQPTVSQTVTTHTLLPPAPQPHRTAALPQATIFGLFGTVPVEVPANLIPESLPETALDMTLTATFTYERTDNSSALITSPGEPGIYYYSGDQLTNGATVLSIHTDAVILDFNGELQSLYFANRQESQ